MQPVVQRTIRHHQHLGAWTGGVHLQVVISDAGQLRGPELDDDMMV